MSNKFISGTIGNIFDFISETDLTERDFYEHKGQYPVYSGQTENFGIVAYLDTYKQEEPCVTFTTYGVGAGKLFYREGKYTIGRNCMGLMPKKEFKDKINLEWFSYKFQSLFYKFRIGDKTGQGSLNKILIENVQIQIPDKEIQEAQLKQYKKTQVILNKVQKSLNEFKDLMGYKIEINSHIYQEQIKKVFDFKGGNTGLTEEFVYNNTPENDKDSILILSSATLKTNLMGYVSRKAKPDGKDLIVFKAPAILVARNGYAGTMTYIPYGEFTTNDHAYVLTPKKKWKDKINLRWFSHQYQGLFHSLITSRSDNATFNKTHAEKQLIEIPDIDIQDRLANKLLKIDPIIDKLEYSKEKLEELILHEIV